MKRQKIAISGDPVTGFNFVAVTEDAVVWCNDALQEYISHNGNDVPTPLIKLISDLDWAVRTGSTQRG